MEAEVHRIIEAEQPRSSNRRLTLPNCLRLVVNDGKVRREGDGRRHRHILYGWPASKGTGCQIPPSGPIARFTGRTAKAFPSGIFEYVLAGIPVVSSGHGN